MSSTSKLITIGVIGNGFVGKATSLFAGPRIKVLVYDIDPQKCNPMGTTLSQISKECKVVFICVPTPVTKTGKCYLKIVESVIGELKQYNFVGHIVVRSTVPPGTCKKLQVHHMPEFLRERSWEDDFRNTSTWIVGMDESPSKQQFRKIISDLLDYASQDGQISGKNVYFANTSETELVKYARNAFLATKVSFFNEIYQYAEKLEDVNYQVARKLITIDSRIGEGHSDVPGPDNKKGFGGTCFPKDLTALKTEMNNLGAHPILLSAVWNRNSTIDRPERDWEQNVGRSVID